MSRHVRARLLDVLASLDAIDAHLTRGELSDGLVFDAVRVRLRDHLAHRYFDTTHSVVAATVHQDLPKLRLAVERLLRTLG